MKKRYALILVAMLATTVVFTLTSQEQQVQVKTTHVAGNVYMLVGRGGNIGVSVGDDGVVMVDDQFAPISDEIKAAIKELGGDRPKFILNTHWHGDHTGGNEVFGREGSTIVAHTNVRKRLSTEQKRGERVMPPKPKEAWPVITFDESLSIHMNGEEIRALHVPNGHTDGDAIIFFTKSNVVHMGDQFFSGRFPFVDLNSGGSVEGYIQNVEKVLAEAPADAKIIPGHGPLSTVEDLKAFRDMLRETTAIVKRQIEAGKSLEEVKAAGLPDKWSSWASNFIPVERWVETIYRSYTREMSSK